MTEQALAEGRVAGKYVAAEGAGGTQLRAAEWSRAVLIYDTVNRTLVSRLIYLGAFQALPFTRIMPSGRYAAARLRPPGELAALMGRHGLRKQDICAFKPKSPRSLITATLARRRGRITDEEIPPIVSFVLDPHGSPVVTYFGHASKTAVQDGPAGGSSPARR